jgi:hypothetical protein
MYSRVAAQKFRTLQLATTPSNDEILTRCRYPKHVWSPAGGWYTQPKNWKVNTAVMLTAVVGVTALAWKYSAENEFRTKFPEEGRFYPSR